MKLATAFVELRADRDKLKGDLGAVEQDVKKHADSAAKLFAEVFSAAAFGAVVKGAIGAASDLNETVSKTKQLFGEDADAVIAFSKTTAQAMGLSQRAYLDATSGLKGLLDNLGLAPAEATEWSQKLTSLGADLGSFFNKDPAEAVEAIGSALRGETEPIRAFNVQISDAAVKQKALELGLYDGVGALDANGKAQATLALIMQQTTAAQGDFTRTSDGAANSQRIAKAAIEDSAASLGQAFLPIYTRAVQLVTALATEFGKLPAPIQLGIVGLAGVVALAAPIEHVVNLSKDLSTAMTKVGISGAGAGLALAGLGIVLITATTWYSDNAKKKQELIAITNEFVDALNAEKDGQKGAVDAAIAKGLSDKKLIDAATALGLSTSDLAKIVRGESVSAYEKLQKAQKDYGFSQSQLPNIAATLGVSTDGLIGKLDGLRANFAIVNTALAPLNDGFENAQQQMSVAAEVTKSLGTAAEDTSAKIGAQAAAIVAAGTEMVTNADLTKAAQDRAAAATQANSDATDDLKASLDDTSTSFSEAADAASSLKAAIEAVFGGTQNMEDANRNLQAEIDATTQSLKDNGRTLDIGTEKGRANREQVEKQANAIIDYGVAMVGSGKSNKEATDAINFGTAALKQQLLAAGLTQAQVDDYITTLGLTPENVTTAIKLADDDATKTRLADILTQLGDIDAGAAAEIQADIDEGKFAEAEARMKEIAKARDIQLNLVPGTGLKLSFGPGQNPLVRFGLTATGGIFDKASPRIVGEDGIEAVLPLTKPSRLAALLSDPRVGGPISDAMGDAGDWTTFGGPKSKRLHALGETSSVPSYGGGGAPVQIITYGAERSFIMELARQIDNIRKEGR